MSVRETQSSILGAFLCCSPPSFPRWALPSDLELTVSVTDGPVSPGHAPVSASPGAAVTDVSGCAWPFYLGPRDPNSGPHADTASALATEPSSSTRVLCTLQNNVTTFTNYCTTISPKVDRLKQRRCVLSWHTPRRGSERASASLQSSLSVSTAGWTLWTPLAPRSHLTALAGKETPASDPSPTHIPHLSPSFRGLHGVTLSHDSPLLSQQGAKGGVQEQTCRESRVIEDPEITPHRQSRLSLHKGNKNIHSKEENSLFNKWFWKNWAALYEVRVDSYLSPWAKTSWKPKTGPWNYRGKMWRHCKV